MCFFLGFGAGAYLHVDAALMRFYLHVDATHARIMQVYIQLYAV